MYWWWLGFDSDISRSKPDQICCTWFRLIWRSVSFCLSIDCSWVRQESVQRSIKMSFARNRSQSNDSPQVSSRTLQQDLQGSHEALIAFDGYESAGPVLQASVLQRPTVHHHPNFLQRLVRRGRRLFAALRFTRWWRIRNLSDICGWTNAVPWLAGINLKWSLVVPGDVNQ